MNTILITGGAGFIGANFINYFLKKYTHYNILNLDLLTPAANLNNLEVAEFEDRYHFIQGNICDATLVKKLFEEYNIKGVIHFAAESHVDDSIKEPEKFVLTNIYGTFVLLDAVKQKWLNASLEYKPEYANCRFHHISTDEVYGTLADDGYFTEDTPYAPNSPYSASKASSDMLVRSYHHTYGLNTTISNCSNNYGKYQHDEKLIPTIIKTALAGEKIPVYGNGTNIRDWLYVEDHCKAIDLVYHQGQSGETYIIGGNSEKKNIDVVQNICTLLDKLAPKETSYVKQISFVTDRPGHDFRYAVDFSKITQQFDWAPIETFESGIKNTVKWYMSKYGVAE